MAFLEKKPRRWGDRSDGVWVRDAPGLNVILTHLFPKRTESEAFLQQETDITELLKYIEKRNGPDAEYKTTLFHCIVTMVARVMNERPRMNCFVSAGRIYQRDEITMGFVVKRRFTDHSEESLMMLKAKPDDTINTISRKIVGDVHEIRERKQSAGIDNLVDGFARIPRPFLMIVMKVIRILDYWGKSPKVLMDGNTNYASVMLSNLGSIKCPSVYHHLNNYGTTSVFITIGTMHKAQKVMEDGSVQIRDVVDIGATVDERIADGFYFARSLKLINHICSHPEMLELPLEEESGYEYR